MNHGTTGAKSWCRKRRPRTVCRQGLALKPPPHSAGLLYLALAQLPPFPHLPLVEDGIANAVPIVPCLLGKPPTGTATGGQGGRVSATAQRLGLEGLTAFRSPRQEQATDLLTGDGPPPRASYRSGRRRQPAEWRHRLSAQSPRHAARAQIARVGGELAATKGLPFRTATDGETVSGKFTGTVQLSSGKFAMVEQSHEFTLVPWRPRHRPTAWQRGQRHRSGRFGVVAGGTAKGIGTLEADDIALQCNT